MVHRSIWRQTLRRSGAATALALFAIMASTAHGQMKTENYTWKNVNITAGGFITGIVFHPTEAGLAYVRTDIGGAYRWDNQAKRWEAITDWVGPRENNLGGCESVAVDPSDPNKVYLALGTYSRGQAAIARSADRGTTFQVTNVPFTMGGNEDGRGMGERLAVDPSDGRVLYFGSRHDGLWTSTDSAVTWRHVDAFPIAVGAARGGGGNAAPQVTWEVFDVRDDDKAGTPTRSIFAGTTTGLFHSGDAGKSWQAVPAAPAGMMPHHAVIERATHTLFIAYGSGPGPNNVMARALFKLDIDSGKFTNINPEKGNLQPGGYGGLALDPRHTGTLMVATIDRWNPGDDIFRTTDGGATWKGISATATRDPALSPYLYWGQRTPRFGWWLAALAIDPFDSDHVLYGTGATIWGTHEMTALDAGRPTRWSVEAQGIEETAVLALISLPEGPPLISGVGDIGGFTHEDLAVSPASGMHENPRFNNTTSLDFAQLKPNVVVRNGSAAQGNGAQPGGATAAVSEDGGKTWQPVRMPATNAAGAGARGGGGGGGGATLALSSDGTVMMAIGAGNVSISRDKGATWTASTGLFAGARPIADRAAPATFYALDAANGRMYVSTDGGASFSAKPSAGIAGAGGGGRGQGGGGGGGGGGGRAGLKASFARAGDLWIVSGGALFHTTDAGTTFARTGNGITVTQFALGKAAPGRENPALFASGTAGGVSGIYRSDDDGASWVRINDAQHQFGGNLTVMAADPRIFGRVYLGMNGRGIVYGEPAP